MLVNETIKNLTVICEYGVYKSLSFIMGSNEERQRGIYFVSFPW